MSLAIHFSAFLILFTLGIHRLLCCICNYLKNPSLCRSKTWYFSEPKWKNLDLYSLLIILPIASFSHVFLFLAFSGNNVTYKFSFLQQSLVIFFFWVLLILIVVKESFDLYAILDSLVYSFAGVCFAVEFLMNGKGLVGVSGDMYGHLGELAFACAGCCLCLAVKPSLFFVEFLFSSVLVLKGTWVLHVGLSLYTDMFSLDGCENLLVGLSKGKNDVKCDLEENKLRGTALMNLLFIVHVIVVMIMSLGLFALLNRNKSMRCGDTSGPLLAQVGSEGVLMRLPPELEIE
ncbi:uncharacterized protein LOC129881869 [Solanum dulcamara]|uniref:uncharacterized protein LOC129881869 n=1 Tax=Solanum dulcamara TaxID=45834 RepID=UPI0024850FD9|nr:uncharacterized protein LOC129881869 [Solanum dulcamara]